MFRDDYEQAKKFTMILLPLLQSKLNADKIISFEDLDNESLPQLFDQYAGIDAISIDKKGMRGIALRVQYDVAWDTFTIRAKRASGSQTEMEKRITAIQKGYIYPYLTCQCYYKKEDRRLMSGAICRTEDLYKYIIANKNKIETRKRKCPEGNVFYFVYFDEIQQEFELIRLKE